VARLSLTACLNFTTCGYQRRAQVKDPFQLRKNSDRVLLTRGRDGTVVFIPALPELKETSDYLKKSGFRPLD